MKLRITRSVCCFMAAALSIGTAGGVPAAELDRAEQLLDGGSANAALEIAETHLRDSSEDPRAQFIRARALGALGKNIAAIETYEQLIHNHPDISEAYINLAVLYAQRGDSDTARSLLLQAISAQKSCSVAYENLSRVHAGMASQAYQKALAASGKTTTPIQPQLVAVAQLPDQTPVNGVAIDPGAKVADTVIPDADSQTATAVIVAAADTGSSAEKTSNNAIQSPVIQNPVIQNPVIQNPVIQNPVKGDAEIVADGTTQSVPQITAEIIVADASSTEDPTGPETLSDLKAGNDSGGLEAGIDTANQAVVKNDPASDDSVNNDATRLGATTQGLSKVADSSVVQTTQPVDDSGKTETAPAPTEAAKDLVLEPVEPVGVQGKIDLSSDGSEPVPPGAGQASVTETKVEVAAVSVNPDSSASIVTENQTVSVKPSEVILETVKHWSEDWSKQNVVRYLSYYAKDFKPNRGSLSAWKGERRKRLKKPSFIKVEIANPQVSMEKQRAIVTFKQKYRSDNYRDTVDKTLIFVQRDGKWRIFREFSRI